MSEFNYHHGDWLYRMGLFETRYMIYPDNCYSPERIECDNIKDLMGMD